MWASNTSELMLFGTRNNFGLVKKIEKRRRRVYGF